MSRATTSPSSTAGLRTIDRLPTLAADLVHRQVAVLASFGNAPALAAKAATATVPIVFGMGEDPVKSGLVASLARPDGNLTGVNFFSVELVAKRLELLRELVPKAVTVAVLVDPAAPPTATTLREVEIAARAMGLRTRISTPAQLARSTQLSQRLRASRPTCCSSETASCSTAGGFNWSTWTLHKTPATYSERHHTEAGGLMSYGASYVDAHRQIGVYTGRILKGAKPADLPVVQSTKFELVINHQTAGSSASPCRRRCSPSPTR